MSPVERTRRSQLDRPISDALRRERDLCQLRVDTLEAAAKKVVEHWFNARYSMNDVAYAMEQLRDLL